MVSEDVRKREHEGAKQRGHGNTDKAGNRAQGTLNIEQQKVRNEAT
jgi:hypothetical protein